MNDCIAWIQISYYWIKLYFCSKYYFQFIDYLETTQISFLMSVGKPTSVHHSRCDAVSEPIWKPNPNTTTHGCFIPTNVLRMRGDGGLSFGNRKTLSALRHQITTISMCVRAFLRLHFVYTCASPTSPYISYTNCMVRFIRAIVCGEGGGVAVGGVFEHRVV